MKWICFILSLGLGGVAFAEGVPDALQIFDRTAELVSQKFYDRSFRGLPWSALVMTYRNRLKDPVSGVDLEKTINDLLAELKASHTEFLSRHDQEYWALKSIFSERVEGAAVAQIGIWFQKRDEHWFAQNVFEGSSAAQAGILPGDEIVAIDHQPVTPIDSLMGARSVTVQFRHSPTGKTWSVKVAVANESFQTTLLRATKRSVHVIRTQHRRIGYIHLWAGTHDDFKTTLKRAAEKFSQNTDAMILDLRDGFGGANLSYLNPFFSQNTDGMAIPVVYRRPLVVLTNGGTRSGKEWLAYYLKAQGRATLVGTRTKGYFLGASPFDIVADQFLLYLAVEGNEREGVNLENNGVLPDVEVPVVTEYAAGKDLQLDAALRQANISNGRVSE